MVVREYDVARAWFLYYYAGKILCGKDTRNRAQIGLIPGCKCKKTIVGRAEFFTLQYASAAPLVPPITSGMHVARCTYARVRKFMVRSENS